MLRGQLQETKEKWTHCWAQRREGGGLPHDQESAKNEKKKNMELLDAAKFKDNLLSNFRSPSHELGL